MALGHHALAFDFAEHAHFSARAIKLLIDEDPRYREWLGAVDAILDSRLLCRGDALFMEAPENCYSLSDIVGLSGDHASSPPLIVWRWFDDFARSRPQRLRLFEIIADTGAWIEPPEESAFRIPARARFLTYMRKFAPRYWPTARPEDSTLLDFDDSYMNVLLRMPAHFRPPIKKSFDEELPVLSSGRLENHPAAHAFAWYADLHLGALTFAALSRGSDDPRYHASAIILELAALHYLQDAVAPGHISADAALGPASTSLTHDRDNSQGMLVGVPAALCEGLGKPPGMLALSPLCTPRSGLEAAKFDHLKCPEVSHLMTVPGDCRAMSFDAFTDSRDDSDPRRVIIYGDGVVASQGRLYGVPYEQVRAVDDWATSLTYMSLREVVKEGLKAGTCDGAWPCDWHLPDVAKIRDNGSFKTIAEQREAGDDGKRYELLVAWWETIGETRRERGARILAGFEAKRFEALRYVPLLSTDNHEYEPIEMISGHTVSVRFGFLHAFADHSRYPDVWSQPIPETRLAYRVVAPRVPVILELGIDVANLRGDEHEGLATHLMFAAGWSFDGYAYAQAGLAFGWLWPAADFSGRWDIELGVTLVDTSDASYAVSWLLEGGDEYGFVTGIGLRGSIGIE